MKDYVRKGSICLTTTIVYLFIFVFDATVVHTDGDENTG